MSKQYSDEVSDRVQQRTKEIFNKFKQSQHFSNMHKYCQKESNSVVRELGRFLYSYELIQPGDWTLDMFLAQVYNIQRKCMYSKNFFKALPKVIYHFSLFCEENNIGGDFNREEIEHYYKDLKKGDYRYLFYSSWEEGYQVRKKQFDTYF